MTVALDRIRLLGVQMYAHHGALEEERSLGQLFEIDCEVAGEFGKTGRGGDDLHWTVDYTLLYREIETAFLAESYQLLETCASELAQGVLARFPAVEEVVLRVRKPHVPMGGVLKGVEVEVIRRRANA
ncbi:MAG: dihydroneopterin aldolase [Calditrichaeota bacterium]|nr:dihydroneopterin aldolase [Calditrichota bacterium]MCB9366737.1 dihydroneopterin aldolase [Calditrichota bacterium]